MKEQLGLEGEPPSSLPSDVQATLQVRGRAQMTPLPAFLAYLPAYSAWLWMALGSPSSLVWERWCFACSV